MWPCLRVRAEGRRGNPPTHRRGMYVRAPCKNCENRTDYCHVNCEAYNNFRAFRDDMLNKKHIDSTITGTSIEGAQRTAKSRGVGRLRRKIK